MIVLDRDVLVKLGGPNPDRAVINHLQRYSDDEWTIPAIVAWESYAACTNRAEMEQTRRDLQNTLDRIVDFTADTALEAAYLDERLRAQGVSLDPADLLNLATAFDEGGTFVTHNKNDFDKGPIHSLTEVDIVTTQS